VSVGLSTLNTTGSEINFTEAPGQHGYEIGPVPGYESEPGSGTATVLAANQTVPVAFTKLAPGQYAVTFTETGLATGTSWSVSLLSTTHSSTGTTLAFTEVNGTYNYSVTAVPGYTLNQSSGLITVAGSSTGTTVVFSAVPPGKFALTFTETGLPGGSDWSVTIGATTEYSNGGNVVSFQEANGTFSYQVGPVSGFAATPSTGSVLLSGAARNVEVTFSTTAGSASSTGGLTTLDWAILAVVALLFVIAALVVLSRRARGRSPPPYPPADSGPENPESQEPGTPPEGVSPPR